MARNGDPTLSLHSAAAAVISQQPHPGQALWYSQQMAAGPPQGPGGAAGEDDKGDRAVLLVVIVSVASFVRRVFMLVLGLLRLSYRKVTFYKLCSFFSTQLCGKYSMSTCLQVVTHCKRLATKSLSSSGLLPILPPEIRSRPLGFNIYRP